MPIRDEDKQVGERIRTRRMLLNMSQTELADQIGITFQQVQKYEKGANRVSASRLLDIAKVLQIQPAWILEGDVTSDLEDGALSPEEIKLLSHFRRCIGSARGSIIAIAVEASSMNAPTAQSCA